MSRTMCLQARRTDNQRGSSSTGNNVWDRNVCMCACVLIEVAHNLDSFGSHRTFDRRPVQRTVAHKRTRKCHRPLATQSTEWPRPKRNGGKLNVTAASDHDRWSWMRWVINDLVNTTNWYISRWFACILERIHATQCTANVANCMAAAVFSLSPSFPASPCHVATCYPLSFCRYNVKQNLIRTGTYTHTQKLASEPSDH